MTDTARTLQNEAKVQMNCLENRTEFSKLVAEGKWDQVLQQTADLSLSEDCNFQLYEQIFFEVLEAKEIDTARSILRDSEPFKTMKEGNTERYLRHENLLSQVSIGGEFPSHLRDSFPSRRQHILQMILDQVPLVPPNRLLSLIQSALRWEEHNNQIPSNAVYDLFHGVVPVDTTTAALDKLPKTCFNTVQLPTGSHVECAAFSSDSAYFVVGTADGFLEVWEPVKGALRTDLPYQTGENDVMVMSGAITCLAFSEDCEFLACGTISGEVGVWRLSTGKLVKAFPKCHEQGITHLAFSADNQSILSCGFDNQICVLGMKSGRVLKECRGHQSYVNCALWLEGGKFILSASHDGSVRLWDSQRVECIGNLSPPESNALSPPPIRSIVPLRTTENDSLFLVVTQSHSMHIFSLAQRAFLGKLSNKSSNFVSATVRKGAVFALLEDGNVLAFRPEEGSGVVSSVKVCEVEPINLCSHPSLSTLVTFDISGTVKFWK